MKESSSVFEIIDETLNNSYNKLYIKEICEIAGVSRSGYYAWKNSASVRAEREEADRRDFELILAAYKKRGYSKGAKGIYMTLLHEENPVRMNLKKIRRIMKKYGLMCPVRKANPYRRMAKKLKTDTVVGNILNREFEDYGPRVVLLTDITYLPYTEGFAYLSTIIDAYTKQVLSYEVSFSLEIDFVLRTVEKLIAEHGSSLKTDTIIHSDQGCHYTSHKFIELLYDRELRRSMSRKGNCWDNAPQESFYGHMKDHIRDMIKEAKSFDDVREIVNDYIDYYNNERYQWELAKLSPNEFYRFCTTGIYPIDIPNRPEVPEIKKSSYELSKRIEEFQKNILNA